MVKSSLVQSRGVTLIELVLVMVILFIMAGVVAPRLSDSFPAMQVNRSATRILAWSKKARSDAALTGAKQRLVIDSSKKTLWIEAQTQPLKEPGRFEQLGAAADVEEFPDAVVFESLEGLKGDGSKKYLEFDPDGTTTDATIILANDRGDRKIVKVVGATARVTIEDGTVQ